MATILITGATGFVGSHILQAFKGRSNSHIIAACRTPSKLPADFGGEVRAGDLRDAAYRRDLLAGVDVVLHAAAWAAMWGHAEAEQVNFYEPTLALIDEAVRQKVSRFVMTGTVAMGKRNGRLLSDNAPTQQTRFWPHLDYLINIDNHMQTVASERSQMIMLRLGHFVGAGNSMGLIPALTPRLKTHLVPWLAGGNAKMPLIAGEDLGRAFVCTALADGLAAYDSFNICGESFPTMRAVITLIANETGFSEPHFSVPYMGGYAFGWLMEKLNPILPGTSPFLTRAIVHLAEDWEADTRKAVEVLEFRANVGWETAVCAQLAELKSNNYAWPHLAAET